MLDAVLHVRLKGGELRALQKAAKAIGSTASRLVRLAVIALSADAKLVGGNLGEVTRKATARR